MSRKVLTYHPRKHARRRLVAFSLSLLVLFCALLQIAHFSSLSFSNVLHSASSVPPVAYTSIPTILTRSSNPTHHFLVITTVIRNEASYLLEWIAHHLRFHNVSHFYLYDHSSNDDVATVLHPLIANGLVTYQSARDSILSLPDVSKEIASTIIANHSWTQSLCLQHFYRHYRLNTTWFISIDVDEFLDSAVSATHILERIDSSIDAIEIARVPYTTNGRENSIGRDELSTATFLERTHEENLIHVAGKRMYRMSSLRRWSMDEKKYLRFSGKLAKLKELSQVEALRVFHYVTRSYDECLEKRRRSSLAKGEMWNYRINDSECDRVHSSSRIFLKGLFQKTKNKSLERRRRLCDMMWELNEGYCQIWNCCGKVGYRRNIKILQRPNVTKRTHSYQMGYQTHQTYQAKSWMDSSRKGSSKISKFTHGAPNQH